MKKEAIAPSVSTTSFADRQDAGQILQMAPDAGRLVLSPGAATDETDPGGDCCYVIERGLVASYVTVDQNRPTCVSLSGPGSLVGLGTLFRMPTMSRVQSRSVGPAQLWRIPTSDLRASLKRSPDLMDICLQQFQARLVEIQGVAACNARHVLPARCAHWLLRLHGHLGDVLPVTHEFLASVLGVRRAGVTVTLQGLQRSGAIRQQRGSIVIADLDRLQQSACSCAIGGEAPAWPVPAEREAAQVIQLPVAVANGPRAWTAAAIQARLRDGALQAQPVDRIEAVLQVCRAVMERTEACLVA